MQTNIFSKMTIYKDLLHDNPSNNNIKHFPSESPQKMSSIVGSSVGERTASAASPGGEFQGPTGLESFSCSTFSFTSNILEPTY